MIDDNIKDTYNIVAKDNKSVHKRLDKFMKDCQNCGLEEYAYNNYSFTSVDIVDGYNIVLNKTE